VDGLRAVAVLSVIAYHYDHAYLPGGFRGVDIFFVISGYVVCGSLISRPSPSLRHFLIAFYARRVKRLLPALLTMVLLASLSTALLLPPRTRGLDGFYATARLALLGFANIDLQFEEQGYFARSNDEATLAFHPFMHTWSLGVEEQVDSPSTPASRRGRVTPNATQPHNL